VLSLQRHRVLPVENRGQCELAGADFFFVDVPDPATTKSFNGGSLAALEHACFLDDCDEVLGVGGFVDEELILAGRKEDLLELVDGLQVVELDAFHEVIVPKSKVSWSYTKSSQNFAAVKMAVNIIGRQFETMSCT